jgi:L-alanine-DL-glutamate epimerase-like enolase superfamily enzyme
MKMPFFSRLRQCRASLCPSDVLVGDANTGWTTHGALKVAAAVKDIDVYLEQPCKSFNGELVNVDGRSSRLNIGLMLCVNS